MNHPQGRQLARQQSSRFLKAERPVRPDPGGGAQHLRRALLVPEARDHQRRAGEVVVGGG